MVDGLGVGKLESNRMCDNPEKVRQLGRSNWWLSTRVIVQELNLDRERVRQIFIEDSEMGKHPVKIV